eukprot:Tbor_TRINITY_DN1997_c0_g1::TRINITY_DN1997_c0_g1_i1::g.3556::m.3556
MGCTNSNTKDSKQPDEVVPEMPEGAKTFIHLANEENHPLASRILQEWSIFVSKYEKMLQETTDKKSRNNGGNGVKNNKVGSVSHIISLGDVYINQRGGVGLTHKKVDKIGSLMLEFLKYDLQVRDWGANFTYLVSGAVDQGFIHVTCTLECPSWAKRCSSAGIESGEYYNNIDAAQGGHETSFFDIKISYYTPAPSDQYA